MKNVLNPRALVLIGLALLAVAAQVAGFDLMALASQHPDFAIGLAGLGLIGETDMGEVREALAKINDGVKQQGAELNARVLAVEQYAVAGKGFGIGGNDADDVVTLITKDAGLQALASGTTKNTATIRLPGGVRALQKAALTNISHPAEMQRLAFVGNDPRRRLRLLDVLPQVPMTTGSAQYLRLNGYVNAAATQATQGAAKAEAAMPTTVVTVEASTIAHYLPASTQILSDAPLLESQIRSLLLAGLLDRLERELISGPGTAGRILGLSAVATAFVPTVGLSPADRVGEAAASSMAAGWNPSVVVLHPMDFFKIQSAKATTNEYIAAGGWTLPPRPSVWGMDAIVSAGASVGSALVFDASQVAFLDRQGASIDIGWIGSQFIENMMTILAELRGALAVFSPASVQSVTLV